MKRPSSFSRVSSSSIRQGCCSILVSQKKRGGPRRKHTDQGSVQSTKYYWPSPVLRKSFLPIRARTRSSADSNTNGFDYSTKNDYNARPMGCACEHGSAMVEVRGSQACISFGCCWYEQGGGHKATDSRIADNGKPCVVSSFEHCCYRLILNFVPACICYCTHEKRSVK